MRTIRLGGLFLLKLPVAYGPPLLVRNAPNLCRSGDSRGFPKAVVPLWGQEQRF